MQIRWSPDAADDLESIVGYIGRENPDLGRRIGQSIYERLTAIRTFPYSGRIGRVDGTRELPLPPLPFIVVYRVLEQADAVEVVNIIHGSQRWPPFG